MSKLPITTCPDGAGSLNNSQNSTNITNPVKYVPPDFCSGEMSMQNGDDTYQEQLASENLQISGANLNVFKLLGVHEQGRLVDLVGAGSALNGSANAFDALAPNWVSPQTGLAVLTDPAWLGYDFGTEKTEAGAEKYGPPQPITQHITTLRITQPVNGRRALQIRVERSAGDFKVVPGDVQFTGAGNGTFRDFTPGPDTVPGSFMLTASSSTQFQVYFTSGTGTELLGLATVNTRYSSKRGSFLIASGTTAFTAGDMFTVPVQLDWYRVDVLNLPDQGTSVQVRIKQSAPARFWRIVPTSFSGVVSNSPWEVQKLELFEYQSTTLDDIQDPLFMENRDRDYAKQAIELKVAYQPFDAISDLSKFGFQIADTYNFTTTFASMVKALGRPVVIGDVLELPNEVQYDHNLNPVKKFLEVSDVSWSAEGFTTAWRPILYRFQASQLIPSQEHRDLFGTVDTQKYSIDDSEFFSGAQQLQTAPLTVTEAVNEEARKAAPEKGTDITEYASGTNRFGAPGTYDGVGLYVEDGLPPDNQPYTEGFVLPDVAGLTDGVFFRLNYDPATKIPSRLYKFSALKNKWIYVETDRRGERTSHKPSQREIFERTRVVSLKDDV